MIRHYITLIETMRHLPVGFVEDEPGFFGFSCDTGSGVIIADFEARVCSIYEFQSHGKAAGEGRRTLQWLRKHFDRINVIDPGDEDSTLGFWTKMRDEGLVDALYDEEHHPIP